MAKPLENKNCTNISSQCFLLIFRFAFKCLYFILHIFHLFLFPNLLSLFLLHSLGSMFQNLNFPGLREGSRAEIMLTETKV